MIAALWALTWVGCSGGCSGGKDAVVVTPDPAPLLPEATSFQLTDAPVPGFPELRTNASQHLQLDLLPARLTLPVVKLPPKVANITDEFVLVHEEVPNPKGAARQMMVLKAPLPFPVELDEQTFKPEGMYVSIDGKPVPFGRGPAPQARKPTWRINGKQIILSYPTMPAEGTVRVRYAGVRDALNRHDPALAGLPPEAFVRYDMTLQGTTRHGLLLPAPTAAEWDVTLPVTSATFETFLAVEPSPLDRPRSDGATVTLSVVHEGRETQVESQALTGPATGFQRWRVDLSRWAGKPVTVRLVTDPGETTTFDWVFAGSPSVWGPPQGEVRRVVVVALDTTRPDRLSFFGYGKPTTPEIDGWARNGVAFDRTWSTAPRTRPSFRSSTTGRLPLDAVGATNIAEVFERHGFATAGFVANIHLQPRFNFDSGFDGWAFDGRANAQQQVDSALAWLGENQERDSYVFVHFMDPHMIYDAPAPFRDQFVTDPDPDMAPRVKRADVVKWMKDGTLDDRRKKHLQDLHNGELAYTSNQLGRLFNELDRMPGRTLVVLYSDHGEEFWEHEGFEHNHSLYDEVTRTVLILRPRGGLPEGRRLEAPTSLMDLAPTLYDLFGFADAPEVDGRSLVPLLANQPGWVDRPVPVAYLQYSHERWGVVWNDHKYMLHTGTGREELYDLKADPGETKDLAAEQDLAVYRQRLHEAHTVPVGPGWRVRVALAMPKATATAQVPMVLTLPAPARFADVLDPESIVEHRANIEWGELPRRISSDVGAVSLSEDRQTLTFTPGNSPDGILYVMFDEPQDPVAATVTLGAQKLTLTEAKRGRAWKDGDRQIVLDPGIIVIPPATEADRMGIGPGAAAAKGEMDELCALGYVECEADEAPSDDDEREHGDREDQEG